MGQNHLLRLASPKSWYLKRKENKYITRPMPGPHPLKNALTLSFVLREVLEYAKTIKEIKKVLSEGQVLVDGIARKDSKFPVGLMDVISIPKLEENYRVVFNQKGNLCLISIKKAEQKTKLLKIVKKTMIKGGKLQVTFHDGRNLLVDKFKGFVGDAVLFNLDKKNIDKLLSLEKGALVYLNSGSHIGKLAKVLDIIKAKDLQKPKVVVEIEGNQYITLAEYAFVVGKDKPEIEIEVKK